MKTARVLVGVAVALGLVATASVYQIISSDPFYSGPVEAALIAGLPFFGVALLALRFAAQQRDQPNAPLDPARVQAVVLLLVLCGVWVYCTVAIWGL